MLGEIALFEDFGTEKNRAGERNLYRYIKNIFNKKFDINNNKKSDINNNVTEAVYFEVKNDDPENRD